KIRGLPEAYISFANSFFHFGLALAKERLYSNSVDSSTELSIKNCMSAMLSIFICITQRLEKIINAR
ncbi:hypothetical protein, partial [Bacteroides pyogenes]|uniref:hypothetical protein n=1 Tax=Bacteroides pyogenes TaxID=310300 RepID=UPI001E590A6C